MGKENNVVTMENSRVCLKKSKTELPYDPTTPLCGIHSKELKAESCRDICTSILAALFTIAKTWKQPSVHQQMNG